MPSLQDYSFWLYLFGCMAFTLGMITHSPSKVRGGFFVKRSPSYINLTEGGGLYLILVFVVTCPRAPNLHK